jgi:hypothetical protein
MASIKNDISINLNCYTIRFKKRFSADNYLTVAQAFNQNTFKQIIQNFIKTIDNESYVNDTNDRVFYIEKSINLTDKTYTAIIRRGHSGHETNVDEIKAKKATKVSTILKGQFSTIPFFILLCQPEPDSTVLIFLAQSYKQFGFKEVFEAAFQKFYKDFYKKNDVTCEVNTLSLSKLFEEYVEKGSIRNLRFIKHILPRNLDNLLDDDDDKNPKSYSVEMSISAKTKGFMGVKKNIKFDNNSFIEIYKIDGFEYDEVVADVRLGNRLRVLNISKPSDFSASYDLTEESDVDVNTNHPNFDKLNNVAIEILNKDIIPSVN